MKTSALESNIAEIDFRVAEKSSWRLQIVYRFQAEAEIDIHLLAIGRESDLLFHELLLLSQGQFCEKEEKRENA